MQNRIIENYCSGVYLSPDQVIQLLKDMEQDPKVLEDLEGLWSNGQIAVLKKHFLLLQSQESVCWRPLKW